MKIGMDISQIVYSGSGVARFTNGLVESVCAYDKDNEWHFFFASLRRGLPHDVTDLIHKKGFHLHSYKLPPKLLSFIWNDIHAVNVERFTGNLDWFITSDWTEPPSNCRKVTIVHDLAYLRFPETFAKSIVATQRKRMKHVIKESDLIFADSEATRQDILQYFTAGNKHIVVNYPGLEQHTGVRSSTTFPFKDKKFILTVGKREPRKNLDRLIEAYKRANPENIDLVIVGEKGWGKTPDADKHSRKIHFLGFVDDNDLALLYSRCLFFIYPSIWEGFGYPVIEAMSYGAPVATSRNSSLGEIAKDNALLFDPSRVSDIASAIQKMSSDAKLRKRLASAAKSHAETFTWKRYYTKLVSSLKENLR